MIKINLLREKGKKAGGTKIPKELLIFFGSLIVMVVLLLLIQWRMGKDKDETIAKINTTEQEIQRYQVRIAEAKKAKEAKEALQEQLNIIDILKKEKGSPAKVLDELSVQKPEKMHFESVKKEGMKLGVEGVALDDETIANFMTSLRNSKRFRSVDLIVSEQIEQSKVKLKKFTISCEINLM